MEEPKSSVSSNATHLSVNAWPSPLARMRIGPALVVWLLFLLICFGLGYPTLNRYDPRTTGSPDSAQYYNLVTGGPQDSEKHFRYRVLVPLLAKPFYWLAKGLVGTWDPALFGLLVANALLCATTAFLLVHVGCKVMGDYATALSGGTLYLLNFTISNSHLSGLVDSGEGCLLMGMGWALFADNWAVLPLLAIVGALAKETFVPLAIAFAGSWWLVAGRQDGFRLSRIAWVSIMATAGLATVTVLQSILSRHVMWPWDIVTAMRSSVSFLTGLLLCVLDPNFWYVFMWLVPLGVWRLGRLPQPWVWASSIAALIALALGAYHDSRGSNVARAMFNAAGPILSLSVAALLTTSSAALRCRLRK